MNGQRSGRDDHGGRGEDGFGTALVVGERARLALAFAGAAGDSALHVVVVGGSHGGESLPQPASIIEWWGPYDALEEVRDDVRSQFTDGQQLLCMAVQKSAHENGTFRCQHVIGWERRTILRQIELPAECHQNDDGSSIFYLGLIVSHYAKFTLAATEWALISALRPIHNGEPAAQPPGNGYAGPPYCVSVVSWFYALAEDEKWKLADSPPGFPEVVRLNLWHPNWPD